jgi:putative peptidoglycan lipid II flippase
MVTAGILLSRLTGLLRQTVSAHFFGTSAFADVLRVSFQVGNITQNLLGEGTLSASFIPIYAKLRAQGRSNEASQFALSALGLLLGCIGVASIVGVVFAPQLAALIAGGFDAEKLAATTRVVRVAFPMTGLLALSAWGLGVLNAHGRFFLPYAAPVLWSLAQIAAMVVTGAWLHWQGESLAMAVAWGALVGAVLQLAVLLPTARALLGGLRPRFDHKSPSIREALRRLPGALLGRGVVQLSGLVDAYLVSFVGTGANAVFGYAQTIYLLPMALLGTGEAAATLPEMARDTASDRESRNHALKERLGASLSRITVLTLPTTTGLALLGGELITLLLQTGRFDRSSTAQVEPVLAVYGLALLANAGGRVLTTTAYALGDTRRPAQYAVVRVLVSTIIALALVRPLGVLGVVLGSVIAAWIELIAMAAWIRKEIGGLGLEKVPFARVVVLSAASVGAGVAVRALLPVSLDGTRPGAAAVLISAGVVFAVVAPWLRLFDVRSLLRR